MHIIIAGCGKIGTTIVSNLVKEEHDVVAIDANAATVAEVNNIYDVMGVCGNSTDCETLAEAGVDKAEMFVAVTGSGEMNMLSCYIAKKNGRPKHHRPDSQPGIQRQQSGLYAADPGSFHVHQSGAAGGPGTL